MKKLLIAFLALASALPVAAQSVGDYLVYKWDGSGWQKQVITPGANSFLAWNVSSAPIPMAFTSVATVGTITTGTWQATAIADNYIASAATWNAKQNAITFGTGVQSALAANTVGSGGIVLAGSPTLTTPNIGAATGTSLSFSGGGTISGSSGAVSLAASGTNQSITLLPSGTGRVLAQSATGDAFVVMDAASGFFGGFRLQTAGTDRWTVAKQATSQDLIVSRFNSSGVFINNPVSIVSATGQVLMPSGIASTSSTTGTLVVTGGAGISGNLNLGGSMIVASQTPASASAAGTAGTIAWDASYIYVCTAANTWKRVAISTW